MVTSSGEIVTAARGDPDFDGLVVGLGALGVVTRLTLDVEPAYEVRQRVFEELAWDRLFEHFDAITGAGYSVSVLTRWGDAVDQVWVKSRVTDAPETVRDDLFGARPATVERHLILGLDPVNCTPQLGRPGSWADRLPHFRMGFTPSSGAGAPERVPRAARARRPPRSRPCAPSADRLRPLLQVCEIRTVAADRLWMSPQYERDTVGLHFTWTLEPEAVLRVLADARAGARALRRAPALGQAVPHRREHDRHALRAPARLRPPRREARSARRLPERLARGPRARRPR